MAVKGMQYPNEIGFDDFTKPDLCTENLPAALPKSSARRRHWGQGVPLQARFDIKTLCLRETPALKGGRFTAGGKSIPWLKLAYMKILPTLHKAEVTILEQLVVKHHVRI